VFDAFTELVASADRPLYFHTADASLRRMMTFLGPNETGGTAKLAVKPTIMPWKVCVARGGGVSRGAYVCVGVCACVCVLGEGVECACP
jgi:hypothetical protein